MNHYTTFVLVLVAIATFAKFLLWLRPYIPALSVLEHKEILLAMVGFVLVAIFVAYMMFPAIRMFDTVKVGYAPEYRSPPPVECW